MVGGKDLLPKAVPPTALEMTRMIATCRVVLPATMVRLSAGRMGFSQGEQTLMFLAGANSIFYGEQLLTTANPEVSSQRLYLSSPPLNFYFSPHSAIYHHACALHSPIGISAFRYPRSI